MKRTWTIYRDDYMATDSYGNSVVDEDAFRNAVAAEMAAAEWALYRLGLAVISAPLREEVATPRGRQWEQVGVTFRTETVPALRRQERVAQEAPPELEVVEPEPELEGGDLAIAGPAVADDPYAEG